LSWTSKPDALLVQYRFYLTAVGNSLTLSASF
jgi:hypothetical protein